ncbi:MAG: adenylate/guanylate cyclase domain-containing protein [Actinomycetota bacterium]|nr:adenylate/guanylate cyclase domain-containing protein [Actinomycetota bacterium]
MTVAALVTHHGGTRMLAISAGVSLAVGLALSLVLTVLLSRAITNPIGLLRDALARVREGDYEVRVPVVSSDELGDLSDAFNRMAQGLAKREQLRETFSTYLDKDVARFILSGQFSDAGVEVDVSIMFCHVPGFTPFAERASAPEVVSALNAMFEILVPIIDRHGGHIDKFVGDGLLAVFGAPEGYPDHADRALAAGIEILDAVRRPAVPLDVCIGVNTGRVVAGSIGGAGRLNFSVIGDAINVAARVEAATRDGSDDLLITRATQDALVRPALLVSRGSIFLKGKTQPIELLAPVRHGHIPAVAADVHPGSEPTTSTRGDPRESEARIRQSRDEERLPTARAPTTLPLSTGLQDRPSARAAVGREQIQHRLSCGGASGQTWIAEAASSIVAFASGATQQACWPSRGAARRRRATRDAWRSSDLLGCINPAGGRRRSRRGPAMCAGPRGHRPDPPRASAHRVPQHRQPTRPSAGHAGV